ncbi:hypothetical protein FRC00_009873 [Tulasnella sp. 408]|nr:hypothetical protein FRC00_009873 [Tulasnella sp. 408]
MSCNSPRDIQVSTTFFPGSATVLAATDAYPDLIIQSEDMIFFYAHSHIIKFQLENCWGPSHSPSLLVLSEPASVLNLCLHVVYGLTFTRYHASLDLISRAVAFLMKRGLDLVATSGVITEALLECTEHTHPFEVYRFAAHYGLVNAAIKVSECTLAHDIAILTAEQSLNMGSVFLHAIVKLHTSRNAAFRQIFSRDLVPHEGDCADSKPVSRAWSLATAYILAKPNWPGIKEDALREVYEDVWTKLDCDSCRIATRSQAITMIQMWENQPRQIDSALLWAPGQIL